MILGPEDYAIHNRMEDFADLAIQQVLGEDPSACGCPLCRADMKCLILNRLKPVYSSIADPQKEPEIPRLEDLERELFNEIMVETHRALAKVKEQPRHKDQRSRLHNELEEFVVIALREVLTHARKELSFAQLSQVIAFVLNDLKPRYTTTHRGSAFSRTVQIDPDYLARIYSSIYGAFSVLEVNGG